MRKRKTSPIHSNDNNSVLANYIKKPDYDEDEGNKNVEIVEK